jgi:hypothetical protein
VVGARQDVDDAEPLDERRGGGGGGGGGFIAADIFDTSNETARNKTVRKTHKKGLGSWQLELRTKSQPSPS